MNRDEAKQYFLGLSPTRRGLFLALLSHNLTVAARGYYEVAGGPAEPSTRQAAFERLNEIQHRLSAHFRKLLGDPEAGFPDEVITDVLFDWAEPSTEVRKNFLWAFEQSAQHYRADVKKSQPAKPART